MIILLAAKFVAFYIICITVSAVDFGKNMILRVHAQRLD